MKLTIDNMTIKGPAKEMAEFIEAWGGKDSTPCVKNLEYGYNPKPDPNHFLRTYINRVLDKATQTAWQPIETAPKDGEFLIRDGLSITVVARRCSGEFAVKWNHEEFTDPTEWAPIPE